MKKVLILITMLFCIYSFGTPVILSFSIAPTKEEVNKKLNQNVSLSGLDISKMSVKDFENLSGKKLTLKEKIGFKILQQKLKKDPNFFNKVSTSSKGKTALTLGIIGLASVFVGLALPVSLIASVVLAIMSIVMGNKAYKEDPTDKKGKTAALLGWVTLGLLLVFILAAALFVAAFAGAFGG